jgi:hypothetical protein
MGDRLPPRDSGLHAQQLLPAGVQMMHDTARLRVDGRDRTTVRFVIILLRTATVPSGHARHNYGHLTVCRQKLDTWARHLGGCSIRRGIHMFVPLSARRRASKNHRTDARCAADSLKRGRGSRIMATLLVSVVLASTVGVIAAAAAPGAQLWVARYGGSDGSYGKISPEARKSPRESR